MERTLGLTLIVCALLYFECGFCTPRIGDSLQNVTTYAGEDASFTCTLEFPNKKLTHSDIAWKKNGEWMVISDVHADKSKYELSTTQERLDDGLIVIHKTLLVKNVDKNDAGQITCVVVHQQHVMTSAWLRVLRKILPTPECNHNPKIQRLGDVATSMCKTEAGEPPVRLKMYQIKPSGERVRIKEGFQSLDQLRLDFNLTITRENIADLIVCEVSISDLRGLESCTIDLLGEMIHRQKGEQEVRVVPLNAQPTYVGESTCFLCNIYDHEDANVVWSLDGRADVTSNVSRQYQYCFKDMQLTDNGKVVTCNIVSEHMVASSSATIEVIEQQRSTKDQRPTTKEPVTTTMELVGQPESRLDSLGDVDAHKGNTRLDLMQIKIMLVVSLMIIMILIVVIIQLIIRSRRSRGGCLQSTRDNFARLSTISDRDIDQRYPNVGFGDDNGESVDHMLLRQRKSSDDTETEENRENETETAS